MGEHSKVVRPAGTPYIVFAFEVGGEGDSRSWREIGNRTAVDAQAAIRHVIASLPLEDRDGTFAAVPVRFFTALKVKPRVVTEYDIEEAK